MFFPFFFIVVLLQLTRVYFKILAFEMGQSVDIPRSEQILEWVLFRFRWIFVILFVLPMSLGVRILTLLNII